MDGQRVSYQRHEHFSPYQSQNPANTLVKKKYTIGAPRPGREADNYKGLESLAALKKASAGAKRSMLEDVPILLQSRNRRVIKFTPRIISDSTSAAVSVQDNIGAVQEVVTEEDDIVAHLNRRKLSFGVVCSECSQTFYSRMQLCLHFSTAHGIPAPVIQKEFDTDQLFRIWLNAVKRTHAVNFVHSSGSRNYNGKEQKISYLQCSRSGDPKLNTHRSVKRPRGTSKCGKTCLAYLKVSQNLRHGRPWGPLKVEGCLQHSGHNIDPEKISLTFEEERAVQQLMDRHNSSGPIEIALCRAILYPCARFRLVTDDALQHVLPKWMWMIRSMPNDRGRREEEWAEMEEERGGQEVEEEEEEEEEDERLPLPPSGAIEHHFEVLDPEMLEYEDAEDFVSVV